MGQEQKLVKQFDQDGDGRLNKDERTAAREFIKKERAAGRGGRGFGGPGGPGGPGGFGPGGMIAAQAMSQGDKDADEKLSKDEFAALADTWFDKLDAGKAGKLTQDEFAERFNEVLPPPPGSGPPAGPGGGINGGGNFRPGPGRFIGPGFFTAADTNKDGSLTREEWKATLARWFNEWDADKNASLNPEELRNGFAAAIPRPQFGGPGGPGGFGGPRRENREPPKPGPRVSKDEAKQYPGVPLYEPTVLRTFFLDFESPDWEAELSELRNSDVEVPATLTVDGKTYPNVGVHFRGMSSLMMVGDGFKRSLGVSMNFVDKGQRLYGYRSLNLLNAHEDASFLRPVLYSEVARHYVPTPKVNLVKVVINGESWGVYDNAEQFNKDMMKEWFPERGGGSGARWKVRGSPGGRGGLEYLGDEEAPYRQRYTIKTADVPQVWRDLIALCRTLNETPPEKLEAALEPILDVDGVLWFLALENAFINGDGYWIRASDFSIYQDTSNKFHILPSDINEVFVPPMGPGMGPGGPGRGPGGGGGFGGGQGRRGGPGGPGERGGGSDGRNGGEPGGPRPDGPGPGNARPGGPGEPVRIPFGGGGRGPGMELDPLVGLNDNTKPLRSKLLAVPALRARYLDHVRTLADKWLDWRTLGPIVGQYRSLIEKDVEADTRKLESFEDFEKSTADAPATLQQAPAQEGNRPGRTPLSLRAFADQRRAYLLKQTAPDRSTGETGGQQTSGPKRD
jgi:spore coat protein CotH